MENTDDELEWVDDGDNDVIGPFLLNSRAETSVDRTSSSRKRTRLHRYFEKEDHEIAISRHKQDIMQRIDFTGSIVNEAIRQDVIFLIYSVFLASSNTGTSSTVTAQRPRINFYDVVIWFSTLFTCIPNDDITEEEGRDGGSCENLVEHIIPNMAGSRAQLVQVFIALSISLGFRVRFVVTVDPASSFLPADHEDLRQAVLTRSEQNKPSGSSRKARKKVAAAVASSVVPLSWVEVLLPPEKHQAINDWRYKQPLGMCNFSAY